MSKPVKLHKYFKRIIALTKNKDQANAFKNLIIGVSGSEKHNSKDVSETPKDQKKDRKKS